MKKMIYGVAGIAAMCATSAMAADLPVKAPIYKAPPPQIFSWTGCYIGGNVGGKWARPRQTVNIGSATGPAGTSAASSATFGSDSASTIIGGGQIGCDWQTGPVVFGIEGDADAQHWSETRTIGTTGANFVTGDTFSVRSRWEAAVLGRLGYAWDRTLLYVTGGAAFTDLRIGTNFIPIGIFPGSSFEESRTRVGATIGGGLEYAFLNNWSAGVEGRYTWYGTETVSGGTVATLAGAGGTFTFAPVTQTIRLNTAEVMFKLNYRFGGGGPVMARY